MNLWVLPHVGYSVLLQIAGFLTALGFVWLYYLELSPKWTSLRCLEQPLNDPCMSYPAVKSIHPQEELREL